MKADTEGGESWDFFSKGCLEILQILWMNAEDYSVAVSVSLELLQARSLGPQGGRTQASGRCTASKRDTPIKIRRANIRRESDTAVGVVLFGGGRS